MFQNVQYLLTVSLAPGNTLCVEAEHKTDGSRWRGDFTARCKKSKKFLMKSSLIPEFPSEAIRVS